MNKKDTLKVSNYRGKPGSDPLSNRSSQDLLKSEIKLT